MKEFIEKLTKKLYENVKSKGCPDEACWAHLNKNCDSCDSKEIKVQDVIRIVNQLAEEYNNDVCEWKQHEREIDVYFTECGQAHIFVDGNPEENNYEYCPYCGKKIKVVA